MKKNLLFILSGYHHGGTNKCLQNMLSLLDNNIYNYYIFTTNKDDVYKKIFSKYNIIDCPKYIYIFCNSTNWTIRIFRYIDRLCNRFIYNLLVSKFVNKTQNKYCFNKVIAFEEGRPKSIAKKFNSSKIAWIHCDYASYYNKFKPNLKKELEEYSNFDKIICVSKATSDSFKSFFPKLSNKVDYIYNPLDTKLIQLMSEQDIEINLSDKTFNIISIGRIAKVKQFEIIPLIVNEILKFGNCRNFKWYIIGDGDEEIKKNIEYSIKQYNLNETIICLGTKNNPYPYIKKSNLLVSTSKSEACPYVINEAKILNIPVVSSNFKSAYELIRDESGIITSIEDMSTIIYKLINNIDDSYNIIKKHSNNNTYDNTEIINKLNYLFKNDVHC